MTNEIKNLTEQIELYQISSAEELEIFKEKFLSRKGTIAELFSKLGKASPENRKKFGAQLNILKDFANKKFASFEEKFLNKSKIKNIYKKEDDLTIPAPKSIGSMHPISIVIERVKNILINMGFAIVEGPEIEDEWHNFTALNVPEDHPARDMQDTFYVSKGALRSQTSSVEIRAMEKQEPPIRIVSIGKVYRKEAISARSHCFFNQMEALYINKDVSFADLKTTLLHFVKNIFGIDTKVRFRPSYFPFTEPSAEIDISCTLCKGNGCKICKHSGWVEIGGCGMTDPQVLINCKIDPNIYSGFAWGMGIERISMLLYQIDDIRLFTENDIRFLQQFVSAK